jgi:hypothetical protein
MTYAAFVVVNATIACVDVELTGALVIVTVGATTIVQDADAVAVREPMELLTTTRCWPGLSCEYVTGLEQAADAARSRLHITRPGFWTLKEIVADVAVVVAAGADVIETAGLLPDQRTLARRELRDTSRP